MIHHYCVRHGIKEKIMVISDIERNNYDKSIR